MTGDGSCWLYAILACMGLLEHMMEAAMGEEQELTMSPTTKDYQMSAWLLQELKVSSHKFKANTHIGLPCVLGLCSFPESLAR